jgi:DNA repair protein RecO (recombination protein O)
MNERLRGIVLQHHVYSDTSLIAKVFTESHGLQSYLIKGAYKPKGKLRSAFFQPMTFIEFVADVKSRRDLHFMSEISVGTVFYNIPFDMQKNAVTLFISELLSKTILGQEANPPLYDFLHQSMQWLDLSNENFANFHLYFCFEYSRFLGFYPSLDRQENEQFFDLMEGGYRASAPGHGYYLAAPLSLKIKEICQSKPENIHLIQLNNQGRRELLQETITYFRLHISDFQGLKSLDVLKEVFG